jgi:glycerate kinase
MLTSSYGTGQLIAAALDYNISHIIIGLGGSATNDGGVGMASALGARFLDEQGREVESTGGELHRIQAIDLTGLDPRLRHVRIDAVCDVVNGLTGPEGATRVYGAQKGATQKQIESLEAGMNNLAEIIHSTLGKDVRNLRGSGAAGGLGAGLYAFLGASLQNGVELMCSLLGLEEHLTDADLVLTAEGQLDYQIVFGKGPAGVAMSARRLGVPCFLLVGSIQNDAPDGQDLEKLGISGVLNICPRPMDVHESFDTAFENLSWASEQVVRIFVAGQEKCVD